MNSGFRKLKHIIYAGTFHQARDFAAENNWATSEWVYPYNREVLMGIEGPKRNPESDLVVHRIGTWLNRPDHKDIDTELAVRGF